MRLHIATLFTHDAHGRLVRTNEPAGGAAPRFYLGRTRRARECRVRHDVSQPDADELIALGRADAPDIDDLAPPATTAAYEAVLARSAPVQKIWSGPAFHVGADVSRRPGAVAITADNVELLRTHFASWIDSAPNEYPMVVSVVDGAAVSVCSTVRRTPAAVQAGVETAPEFRGRGFGSVAVAAWADAVRQSGVIPLYSTSWQNVASQSLARKLGLTQFGADLHLT
jgi:GNAT superfamily N-acetyltransferase